MWCLLNLFHQWLEREFLPYLDKWEESVNKREDFKPCEQKRMLLSQETLLGLRMTGKWTCNNIKKRNYYWRLFFTAHSFIELVECLFTLPGVKVFLSQRLCQDPLEKFFGCQQQRGGAHDNPSILDFCRNTQALRVVNNLCGNVKKGNCRGNKMDESTESDINNKENVPLPKRRKITNN